MFGLINNKRWPRVIDFGGGKNRFLLAPREARGKKSNVGEGGEGNHTGK